MNMADIFKSKTDKETPSRSLAYSEIGEPDSDTDKEEKPAVSKKEEMKNNNKKEKVSTSQMASPHDKNAHKKTEEAKTPSDLHFPTFFMVPPFKTNFNVDKPNNLWMQEMSPEELKVDYDKAFAQWLELEQFVSANSLTYLIPNDTKLQDLIYVANMGLYVESEDLIIMSNFTSEPRRGEEKVGQKFFEEQGYKCVNPPPDLRWEGEADLKFVRDNIFSGGYGIRSDKKTFEWMEKKYNMKITKCHMTSQRNYHYDCQFAPLTTEKALVCTKIFDKPDIKELEKIVEIIDIPEDEALAMACNIVRIGSVIMVCSGISAMKASDESYLVENSKIERLNHVCSKEGLSLRVFNLSEFDKSGAALSCNIMHGNFVDFAPPNGEIM